MPSMLRNNKQLSACLLKRKNGNQYITYHGDGVRFDIGFRYFTHVLVFLLRFEEKSTQVKTIGMMRSWEWQRESKLPFWPRTI
jgi:hypothetical protein